MSQKTLMDSKIWLALKARLSEFDACDIHYPMENYKPEASDKFIIVQQVSLDSGAVPPISPECGVNYRGILSLGVCVPTDFDFSNILSLSGDIADHFPNGSTMTYDDVTVTVSGRAKVSGTVSRQFSWNRVEVIVPWSSWG